MRKGFVSLMALAISSSFAFSQTLSFTATLNDVSKPCPPQSVTFKIDPTWVAAHTISSVEFDYEGTGQFSAPVAYNPGALPFHNYGTDGIFTVTLRVTYDGGTIGTAITTVTIHAAPIVTFTPTNPIICPGDPVQFNASVTNGVTVSDWAWTFGNGTTLSGGNTPNPRVSFNETTTVNLVAVSDKGCRSDQVTGRVEVYTLPLPSFSLSGNQCVAGSPISFINITNEAGLSSFGYEWYVGAALVSSDKNMSYSFPAAGSYVVKLRIKLPGGCFKESQQTVTIGSPAPTIASPIANATHCSNTSVTFSTTYNSNYNYLWDFGDGYTSTVYNTTHSYTTTSDMNYTVKLTVTDKRNGCAGTTSIPIQIIVKPSPIISIVSFCGTNYTINYSDSRNYVTDPAFTWNFGDGNTSNVKSGSHTYLTPGTKTVTYTADNGGGCTYTNTYTTHVGSPAADFNFTAVGSCSDAEVPFNAIPDTRYTGLTYRWDFGDGITTGASTNPNTSHKFPASLTIKTYTVTLTVTRADGKCPVTASKTITIYPKPVVTLKADTTRSCATPFTVNFTANTIGGTPPLTYDWIFNGGTGITPGPATTTVQRMYTPTINPCQGNTYGYDARVRVTDNFGCVSEALQAITIKTPGIRYKTITTTCFWAFINMETTNLFADDEAVSYIWDFGDGTAPVTTTSLNMGHYYNMTGPQSYTVKVTIQTSWGCSNYCSFTVTPLYCTTPGVPPWVVIDNPTDPGQGTEGALPFTVQRFCNDRYKFTFTDPTTSPNSEIISWDFGDGIKIDTTGGYVVPKTVTHTYDSSAKGYAPKVILTRKDRVTGEVSYYYIPVAIIDEKSDFKSTTSVGGTTKACLGQSFTFTPQGITAKYINRYIWQSIKQPSGPITTIQTIPNAGGSNNGGSSPYMPAALTAYANAGKYQIRLIIEDLFGCRDTSTVLISVGSPAVDFSTLDAVGCGTTVTPVFTITNDTPYDTTKIVRWVWSFNDGTTRTETTHISPITHTYTGTGSYYAKTYTPQLTITDNSGCQATASKTNNIAIYQPKANFTIDKLEYCGTQYVTIKNSSGVSLVGPYPTATYYWDFGDGVTETRTNSANFLHLYNPGTDIEKKYTIRLVVKQGNCTDTLTRVDYIKFIRPKADFSIDNPLECVPALLKFTNSSLNAKAARAGSDKTAPYIWNWGDGSPQKEADLKDAEYQYGLSGNYKITLRVNGIDGCWDTTSRNIRVRGPRGDLFTTLAKGCLPLLFQMEVKNGSNISKYYWDFGDYSVSNDTSAAEYIYTTPTYGRSVIRPNVRLESPDTSSSGGFCSILLVAKDTIKADRIKANFEIIPLTTCSDSGYVQFINKTDTTSPTQYTWNFGDGKPVSHEKHPRHLYDTSGHYMVTLIAHAPYSGCTDTLKMMNDLQIHNFPRAAILGPDSLCLFETIILKSSVTTKGEPVNTYQWFDNNTPISDSTVLVYPFTTAGMHTIKLVVTSEWGCTDTVSKNIKVHALPTHIIRQDTVLCENASVKLFLQSDGKYFLWTGPNGYTSATKEPVLTNVKPVMTGWYKVRITEIHGCASYDSVYIKVNPLPALFIATNSPICKDQTLRILTTTSPNVHTWNWVGPNGFTFLSDSANLIRPNATVNMSGTYEVTVTDSNSCVSKASANVTVNPLPGITKFTNTPICAGGTITINLTTTGNQFHWVGPDGFNSTNKDVNIPNATVAKSGTYKVTVTDNNHCSNVDSIKFTVHPLPILSASSNSPICDGDMLRFSAEANGTNSYAWSGPTSFLYQDLNITGPSTPVRANATTAMSGNYTVTATDSNACTSKKDLIVVVNQRPNAVINPIPPVCEGSTIKLNLQTNGNTFYWTGPNGFSSTEKAPSIPNATSSMAGYYKVAITDSHNGCVRTDSVYVTINQLPFTQLSYNTPVCEGNDLRLDLTTSGTQYTWTGPKGFTSSAQRPVITPTTLDMAGWYYVNVKDAANCTSHDSIHVEIDQRVHLTTSGDTYLCIGESVEIWANGNTNQFTWTPTTSLSNPAIRNPIANPTVTTTYRVTGHSTNSCPNETKDVKINITDYPLVSFSPSEIAVLAGALVTLKPSYSSNSYYYEWTPPTGLSCINCQQPSFTAQQDMTYTVTVSTQYGCKASASINVKVSCNPESVYIPNAFTPNGDGLNDKFRILGHGIKNIKSLRIFDRYGGLVFSCFDADLNDPTAAWDGTVRGKAVETTTGFVYQIELICTDGNVIPFKGSVLLIK